MVHCIPNYNTIHYIITKYNNNKQLYNNQINARTWNVGRTLEEFANHSPAARDLLILFMFYQHPAWFISL